MEIYLVGGAVRDFLLLRQQQAFLSPQEEQRYWDKVEKDWVVVGASPEEMIAAGFRQVGKSFPVFLHPETHEEYALARTERKVGKGYTGFECQASPDVTLEEDLRRRDLTINAIAMEVVNNEFSLENLIDPYKGIVDLEQNIFRHVSAAFVEDPVRILRLARFACRFPTFTIAPSTLELMRTMVTAGEIDALVAERVWQEWSRSLKESNPWRWFEVLVDCGAEAKLFPQMRLSPAKKTALMQAVENQFNEMARFAILLYDYSDEALQALIRHYKIPNDYSQLASMTNTFYPEFLTQSNAPEKILAFFDKTDAFRRPLRFHEFIKICMAIAHAEGQEIPSIAFGLLLDEIMKIDNQALLAAGYQGASFARELRDIRLKVIQKSMNAGRHSA